MVEINLEEMDFSKLSVSENVLRKWIKNNQEKIKEARELWLGLDTKIISTVENPSHDSDFVALKNADPEKTDELKYSFLSESEEEQIAYAPALVPDELDKDGDIIPKPVVRNSAHNFIQNKRVDETDVDHESRNYDSAISERGTVVESWILKDQKDFELPNGDTKTYDEGVWMVGIKFTDDEVWDKIKNGELKGYSIQGKPIVVKSESERYLKGENNNTNMSEQESEEVQVTMNKEEMVDSITEQVTEGVSDEIDDLTETKEVEVVPDIESYVEKAEVSIEDVIDMYGVDKVAEALNEYMDEEEEDEDEEDSEEDNEEEEEDSEKEETEESEKSKEETEEEETEKSEESEEAEKTEQDSTKEFEVDIQRSASEVSQVVKSEATKDTEEEDEDDFSGLWEV